MRAPMPKPRLAEIEDIAIHLKAAGLSIISDAEIQKTIKALSLTL